MSARPDLWEPRRSNPQGHPVDVLNRRPTRLKRGELLQTRFDDILMTLELHQPLPERLATCLS
ncbi:MAG: hypothetical protein FWH27_01515 [Planctomycetaceae bacterium]|nr:hypothetical protein [Planctomycetaceae bacterium]